MAQICFRLLITRTLQAFLATSMIFFAGCSDPSGEKEETAASEKETPTAVTWRFALEEVEGSVQHAYAQEFKKRIEAATSGAVTVEIYPYGALGTSSQLTELVQGNAIELAFASPGHLASVIPEVGVFTLHFVLSDDNDVNKNALANAKVQEILQNSYQSQGLDLLSIVPEGWMVWTADKPLKSPEDFDGFKMRTMTSPILVKSYEAYGANPTPLPYSEVYSALQLGQIDGQVNPVFAIEEMSFYEEQDVMTFAKHAQFVTTLVAGKGWKQGLTDEHRKLINNTVTDMVDWIYEKQSDYNQERLDKIKEAGGTEVVYLSDAERDAFREASIGVRDVFIEKAGETGKELLDAITAIVEELEKHQ